MCMCVARGGVRGEGGNGCEHCQMKKGECWMCICVRVAVVCVVCVWCRWGVGGSLGQGLEGWLVLYCVMV